MLLPVLGEPPQHQFHEAAGQIGVMALRQNQKPRVVDDQRQTSSPLFLRPLDERIASLQMQRRGAPTCQGQPLTFVGRHVTQVLAHPMRTLQIVLSDDQLIKSAALPGGHQAHR
jgi:hypothetical protein